MTDIKLDCREYKRSNANRFHTWKWIRKNKPLDFYLTPSPLFYRVCQRFKLNLCKISAMILFWSLLTKIWIKTKIKPPHQVELFLICLIHPVPTTSTMLSLRHPEKDMRKYYSDNNSIIQIHRLVKLFSALSVISLHL